MNKDKLSKFKNDLERVCNYYNNSYDEEPSAFTTLGLLQELVNVLAEPEHVEEYEKIFCSSAGMAPTTFDPVPKRTVKHDPKCQGFCGIFPGPNKS